jgi:hypothetical protein
MTRSPGRLAHNGDVLTRPENLTLVHAGDPLTGRAA